MEIPDFIHPDDPDFQGRLVQIHNIKEHLDMLLFAAYACIIERFFRDNPNVQAIVVTNASDASDNGRYAHIDNIDGEIDDQDDQEVDLTDQLADEINNLRDRGIYTGLDAMFEKGRIGRDDVMGQFRDYWVEAEGTQAGVRWNAMLAAAMKSKFEAGTKKADEAVAAGPRM